MVLGRTARVLIALFPIVLLWGLEVEGQQTTRVEDIRTNPRAHVNETRQLEGTVDRFVDMGTATTHAYYLEDDFGHQLRVLTTSSPPDRGERVRVRGVITLDEQGNPYLQAGQASVLVDEEEVVAAPAPEPSPSPPPTSAESGGTGVDPLLLAFGGGFLVLIVVMLFVLMRGQREPELAPAAASAGGGTAAPPAPSARQEVAPDDGDAFDGKTVKFTAPPPGTMKLLPGRLEIIGGDDKGREIRFLNQGSRVPRITFGRSDGPAYKHIQLKAPTVSREHARMTLSGKTWNIENLSTTNPVRVNGHEIPSDGQTLDGGEEIDMGEVKFRFHTK